MAGSQRRKAASTNRRAGGAESIGAAVSRYRSDLERAPLAARTKQAYRAHVGAYGDWLAGRGDGPNALADPRARDYAARDFKRYLKAERSWKPASVNLALAAVDHFGSPRR